MSVNKSSLELAAEITIAAMQTESGYIFKADKVSAFYETIFKQIMACAHTPLEDLR